MSVRVRPAARSDADAIAALLNEHSLALYGETDITPATVAEWLENPEVVTRLAESDGEAAGYGDLVLTPDGARVDLDVRALPSSSEAAEATVDELERVAASRGARWARAHVPSVDEPLRAVLARRGYRPVRHSFRMEIRLDEAVPVPEPVWPPAVTVRTLAPGEERAVHDASQEAFLDHWGFQPEPFERWARWTLESETFDPSLFFLATEGDEIAGVCLCSLHWSGDPRHGWVGTLGVRPRWRRRGIALALLRHAFAEFARRGCVRVGLGVDAESTTGALELYERAGMRVVRRTDAYEKELAPP